MTGGLIAPCTDQAHLIEAMDGVLRRLGGTAATAGLAATNLLRIAQLNMAPT